ncbi:hypothetical protein QBC38DRAFT_258954 [Podospora fimiseda]|uniref:NACHT domain-containing protein n=1 Tax=Podospora fimiseda TaxID=252190 RepID=A0AAN7BWZ1_9PEZI|nr:hypothetical protein QBC38DRAFT_258954 [Podospora fimiseda]
MDPLSLGASIIAIIQISDHVIKACKLIIEAARDAPSDLRLILVEISTLRAVLDNLEFLASCNLGPPNASNFETLKGSILGCRQAMTELQKMLPVTVGSSPESKQSKPKMIMSALAWPMKQAKAMKLLDEITKYKNTMTLAMTTETIRDVKDIKTKVEAIYAELSEMQKKEVFRWLRHTDPSNLHHKACTQYEAGTGDWVLRCPEWRSWVEGDIRCIWIHGIPGAGKTILASHLIETANRICAKDPSADEKLACIYYYCYYGHSQDESEPFLRWVLDRLCRQLDQVPNIVYDLYRRGNGPSLSQLLHAIEETVKPFSTVYIFVDALDESSTRGNLLKIIRDLATDFRFEQIKVLATSREYIDIEAVMSDISKSISMKNPVLDADIRLYVQAQLKRHHKLQRWPEHIKKDVLEALSTKAKGMFRWAVCQLDGLQRLKPEPSVIRRALDNLPRTLEETYDRIFMDIPEEARSFVRTTLKWIYMHEFSTASSSVPCSVLLQAVQMTGSRHTECEDGYLFDQDLLREFCGCLISISFEQKKFWSRHVTGVYQWDYLDQPHRSDVPVQVVSIAHYTVVEYLTSPRLRTRPAPAPTFALDFDSAVSEWAKATMCQVMELLTNNLWDGNHHLMSKDHAEVAKALHNNFEWHCVRLHAHLILESNRDYGELSDVTALAVDLFDSSKPHFNNMRSFALRALQYTKLHLGEHITPPDGTHFWTLAFVSKPSTPDAERLTYIMQADRSLRAPILYKFLNSNLSNAAETLSSHIHVRVTSRWFYRSWQDVEEASKIADGWKLSFVFKGSVLELYAQSFLGLFGGHGGLRLFLDVMIGRFDPSTIMLLYIGRHSHPALIRSGVNPCPACKNLKVLLGMGASSRAPGYAIGSLQIATSKLDVEGVRLLLEAGADPDDVGDLDGTIGTPERGTFLAWYAWLRGQSPLHIIRHRHFSTAFPYHDYDLVVHRHERAREIEEILVKYGAKDFVTFQCRTSDMRKWIGVNPDQS